MKRAPSTSFASKEVLQYNPKILYHNIKIFIVAVKLIIIIII